MENSFKPQHIRIPKQNENKAGGKKKKSTENSESNSKDQGRKDHATFARLIKDGSREGVKGKVLAKLEREFECKFLDAEFDVWGWGVTKSKSTFYSGRVDAIAFRQRPKKKKKKNQYEVLIVDWKTTRKDLSTWWKDPRTFKNPLYQCLVYRELFAKHLERNDIQVPVGVMIVPFRQSKPELSRPGLCVDFKEMKEQGLLQGIEKYRWVSDKSEVVHTINFLGCKLFKELNPQKLNNYVDERTQLLKENAPLLKIIRKDATIGDLRKALGLLTLKATNKVGKEEREQWGEEGNREKKRRSKKGEREEDEHKVEEEESNNPEVLS